MNELKERSLKKIRTFYRVGNRISGGWISIIRSAFARFSEVHATQAAAGIAYYTFFSIFPLLILLVAL